MPTLSAFVVVADDAVPFDNVGQPEFEPVLRRRHRLRHPPDHDLHKRIDGDDDATAKKSDRLHDGDNATRTAVVNYSNSSRWAMFSRFTPRLNRAGLPRTLTPRRRSVAGQRPAQPRPQSRPIDHFRLLLGLLQNSENGNSCLTRVMTLEDETRCDDSWAGPRVP